MFVTQSMTLADLQSAVWDLYKDVTGVRPRHLTEEQWADRQLVETMVSDLVKSISQSE